ncbi:hypothetical protein [uncultured Tateyamaria sp.]|uniref:hypothetical protein n=1 Tax=uncultured Tateyamaria sp. TaxID=455651 RepID=UPI002610F003|nr:hypothetical protein [uncultured Tateyamaria sp.]
MQKPSDQWKKLRRAALERARRNMIEPLEVVHLALLGASALYLAGFLRLNLFGQTDEFSLASGAFVLLAAAGGLLVPVLTGSALTLHFADRRLGQLLRE